MTTTARRRRNSKFGRNDSDNKFFLYVIFHTVFSSVFSIFKDD
jgi:hypothetical protein